MESGEVGRVESNDKMQLAGFEVKISRLYYLRQRIASRKNGPDEVIFQNIAFSISTGMAL
jgi:hypothetical protein